MLVWQCLPSPVMEFAHPHQSWTCLHRWQSLNRLPACGHVGKSSNKPPQARGTAASPAPRKDPTLGVTQHFWQGSKGLVFVAAAFPTEQAILSGSEPRAPLNMSPEGRTVQVTAWLWSSTCPANQQNKIEIPSHWIQTSFGFLTNKKMCIFPVFCKMFMNWLSTEEDLPYWARASCVLCSVIQKLTYPWSKNILLITKEPLPTPPTSPPHSWGHFFSIAHFFSPFFLWEASHSFICPKLCFIPIGVRS